jgi:protein-disulfide isomerase
MEGSNKMMVPASIIFAGILIAGAVIYTAGPRTGAPVKNEQPGQQVALAAPTIDDDVVLGDPNAPVTMIVFGDYECPFCEKMYKETEGQIREQYIKSGKVRMVFRDYPLSFHPSAMPAAIAAECAKDQGAYWKMHDAIFDRQAQIATLDYTKLAGDLGLNKGIFSQCLTSQKPKDEIAKDTADGNAAGVDGTPASYINGTLVSGAQPFAVFKSAIDAALRAAGK